VADQILTVPEYKIKTFRWLFYFSSFQILMLFIVPALVYPASILFSMELMAALTVGMLFALFYLLVSIYGLFIDKSRRPLYIIMTVLAGGWLVWASVSWIWIEHMDYLLK
jgi:hypothetical protein